MGGRTFRRKGLGQVAGGAVVFHPVEVEGSFRESADREDVARLRDGATEAGVGVDLRRVHARPVAVEPVRHVDGHALGGNGLPVGNRHGQGVAVGASCGPRSLEVRFLVPRDFAGHCIEGELGGIGTGKSVDQGIAVGVGGADEKGPALVFRSSERGGPSRKCGGIVGRRLVDVGNVQGEHLGGIGFAVRCRNEYGVAIVARGGGIGLVVGSGLEGEHPGGGIEVELGLVGTSAYEVAHGFVAIRVRGVDVGRGGLVLRDVQRIGQNIPPVGGDHGGGVGRSGRCIFQRVQRRHLGRGQGPVVDADFIDGAVEMVIC